MTASSRERGARRARTPAAAGLTAIASLLALALAPAPAGHARPPEASAGDGAMVRVPAGRFFMGERPRDGRDGHAGHFVTLPELWIDRTEVTARDYQTCVAAGACPAVDARQPRCNANLGAGAADHPINCVEWGAAAAFCRWKGKRLPASAEWERAARGDDERTYPWGKERPRNQLCWQREEGGAAHSCPVGAHPAGASPYGVQDLAGNVAEWTATRVPTPFGIEYVVRGGGWQVEDLAMAAPDELEYRADRPSTRDPTDAALDLGFRCAKGGAREGAAAADWAPGEAPYVFTPPSTSPDHKAIVELVRARMKAGAELRVAWLKLSGDWAYFEGHAAGKAASPASANALLRRTPEGRWELAELLVGPETDDHRADFRARLETRRAKAKLPQGLFSDPGIP